MTTYRGRFAPTPSGLLHIGNAAAALLSWLQIRSLGGEFILRIEDIDGPRSKPEYAEQILKDLRWLGLDWDEGPDIGGAHGPYVQSLRLQLYEEALEKLEAAGRLYPCYCTRAQLAAVASAPHGLASEGPAYNGTCRSLTPEERQERGKMRTPAIRFAVPSTPLAYEDGAVGWKQFPAGAGGDFIVRRSDGIYAYQLAVVVDDAAMGVSHVLRGYDLLDSTPRQLWLYEALGWSAPCFAHIPLLYGPDGSRLSKRHEAVGLSVMQQAGIRPEKVVGLLAYAYGLTDQMEEVAARELSAGFDLSRLPEGPVVLGEKELQLLGG